MTQNENSTTGQHIRIVPLIENIKFCKIATSIQDLLAISPLPRAEDRVALDNRLVEWYDNLPWILRSNDPCPEAISTARTVMKWRYQNLRLVLHRPILLNLAYRGNLVQPTADELAAVDICRAIAKQTIHDISREFARNQMSGWNGVWFLYQASMIPLVSIFWETWNTAKVHEWQGEIEVVLEALAAMSDWSLAARRSREVVLKMYEASKGPITRPVSPRLMPNGAIHAVNGTSNAHLHPHMNGNMQEQMDIHDGQMHGELVMTEHGVVMLENGQSIWDLDGMLWGNLPDGLDMPFDGVSDMEFDEMPGGYDGNFAMH
jgi:hypothetical protein